MFNFLKRSAVVALLMISLAACAQKLPPELQNPTFHSQNVSNLSVGVTDHRDFILSKDKEPWFEGIMHGPFGVPMGLKRVGPTEGRPFAYYLSTMLQASFVKSGVDVAIIELPMGLSIENAIQKLLEAGRPGIIVKVNKSRYAFWMSADYQSDFDIVVVDREGRIQVQKNFAQWDEKIPLSSSYNVFDMFTAIYTKELQKVLDDPQVKAAIEGI
ncbi:hypothetical protein [Terasakiella pusilla]|uniref:hypothetical protein n=1 Tax=Terasakiella pusilla TaxID=64973 RepID=UPI003AA7AACD